jgi:hypothetical protein
MTRVHSFGQRAVAHRRLVGAVLAVAISVLSLPACGPDRLSSSQRDLLIEKIRAAGAIDAENLSNGKTDPTQAVDSRYQAQKARTIIGQLRRGEEVSQSKIDDALDVPSESISPDARSELVRELTTAEKRDELGEQTHGPGNDWLAWDSYRTQRDRANSIMKALKSGEELPWSEIQQALQVPEFP